MSIRIIKPGILTTVQDLGRFGGRRFGINTSGAMDTHALRVANLLVGNDENAAAIEMHFPAAEIEFEQECVLALGGADLDAQLDESPVKTWRSFYAKTESRLKFLQRKKGNRAYLAIRGGINGDLWFNSRSTSTVVGRGGLAGRAVKAGDIISIGERPAVQEFSSKSASPTLHPFYSSLPTVRVVAGPEIERLTADSRRTFFEDVFTISRMSSRMGFQLDGSKLAVSDASEMLSSAVTFGTIQLLPTGQMIVLMADHQTTGGYPRIGNIITRDLPLAGQLGAGDKIAFHLVSIADAEALHLEYERNLNFFRVGCKLLANR